MEYQTTATHPHRLDEELQWARMLSTGRPAEGMALLFIQKLCTAFHEFEAAWQAGALQEGCLDHFRHRLTGRVVRVLKVLEKNNLAAIDGAKALAELAHMIESAETLADLASLSEKAHAINHALCDSLEKNVRK